MAKKKKSKRNRNFSHSNKSSRSVAASPKPVETTASQPNESAAQEQSTAKPIAKPAEKVAKTGFLAKDLKTIGTLAVTAVGLELVLWFLLQHTALGARILGT